MDNGWKLLIGIILVTGCIIGAIILVAGMFYPAGFEATGIVIESTYTYDLTITNDHDLDGLELMVPLPSRNGDTPLGNAIVSSGEALYPEGWDVILVGDSGAAFLKVRADHLPAVAAPYHLTATVTASSLIDTQNPLNDPWQISPASAVQQDNMGITYSSTVYARFDAPDDAVTSIVTTSAGENSWRYPLAGGNSFTNRLGISLIGPASGWHTADGLITAGLGKYTLL
ncbi:hypothetical protein AZH53_06955 [Methanomicrobiaceae archaeon CYW5]|uniref:hypothetical protein n=1 Tax=Methanovulcanius yangii TaxID=1789227 RepID=UPI0029CA4F64|nr:hypothetical protein [Methanovulcanius yangii]MBT8508141.1 hypothetical protein [Methanovulcanius yangii]